MNTALTKITTRAKAIRRAAPKTTWAGAVKKASAEYRAGSLGKVAAKRKKAVGSVKRKVVSVARKRVAGVTRKRVSGVKVATSRPAGIGRVGKAEAIIGTINKLETKRRKAGKELKHILALEINREHDKLDKLKKQYKKL